jgi:endoglucanase
MNHKRALFMQQQSYRLLSIAIVLSGAMSIAACGGGGGEAGTPTPTPTPTPTTPPTPEPVDNQALIKLNQIGFVPGSVKYAAVPETEANEFSIINQADDSVVLTESLGEFNEWTVSRTNVAIADFSSVTEPGNYTISVDGIENDASFTVESNAFLDIHNAVLKAYYFNRASIELDAEYAGEWQRPEGHPDTEVLVHPSAADALRPAGTIISAPKGWYDAGDYNKYVVNSGISTYTLMLAYQHHADFYATTGLNIPESSNTTPDILDEIKWNLDWMAAMQDPNDGGVYHKLTTLGFSGTVMPHQATATRYVVQKGTAATLNFAAVMAMASRIYSVFPEHQTNAQAYRSAAEHAWQWAQANPNIAYQQPSDVSTGEYGDSKFEDERFWAAAELFLLTNNADYLSQVFDDSMGTVVGIGVPNWFETAALGYLSLLSAPDGTLSNAQVTSLRDSFISLSDQIVEQDANSAYLVAMTDTDFNWGSNSGALNKALLTLNAFRLTGDSKYKNTSTNLVDYVLGRNPTDYSFVTGFGVLSPEDPHHRQSFSDSIPAPVPGFVVGGPHSGQQDGCSYPSSLPARSYLDDWCSYSTNEVTINWNAPMVYALASLHNNQ